MLRSPDNKFHSDTDLHVVSGASRSEPNVSTRKRKQPESEWSQAVNSLSMEFKNTLNEWRRDLESSINKISENVISIKEELASVTQVTSEIKNDIQSLHAEQCLIKKRVSELDVKYNEFRQEIEDVKNSIEFVSHNQSDLSKKLNEYGTQITALETPDSKRIISELVEKIDYMEQTARNNNIEICNIPERRNEDLVSLMINIGSTIKCTLKQSDIISIHRVPHAHQDNNRPKNIIVKLTSRILRDNILSAHRLNKGLNAEQLGLSGLSGALPIYMHEHLTLKNKRLFRECHDAAKKHNYRFLWVKHGTILVREKEGSKSIAIRSLQDIAKIKSSSGP